MKNVLFLILLLTLHSCRREKQADLECLSPIVASFEVLQEGCKAPCQLEFQNLSEDADTYFWNFGDGSAVIQGTHATHTYQKPGSYQVSLTATRQGTSCIDAQLKVVNIGVTTFEWGHILSSPGYQTHRIVQIPDQGYLLIVSNTNSDHSSLLKLNEQGLIDWVKPLAFNAESRVYDIVQVSDGSGYMLCGWSKIAQGLDSRPFLAKIDAQGNILDELRYPQFGGASLASVVEARNGGFIAGGTIQDRVLIIKTNSSGQLLWAKQFELDNDDTHALHQLIELNNGDLAYCGNNKSHEGFLARLNAQGDQIWKQFFSTYERNIPMSLTHSLQTGFTLSGYIMDGFNSNGWLIRTNQSGSISWERTYGGAKADQFFDMTTTADGGYLLAGVTESWTASTGNVYLVRTDDQGALLWQKFHGGSGLDVANTLIRTSDGGYAIGGFTSSPELLSETEVHLYMAKTDSEGQIHPD